jgi:hypothetical protein
MSFDGFSLAEGYAFECIEPVVVDWFSWRGTQTSAMAAEVGGGDSQLFPILHDGAPGDGDAAIV